MICTFELEDLDCAHCAAIIEEKINQLESVEKATLNFMTRRLIVEADEAQFKGIVKDIKKIVKKIEPDVTVIEK